MPSRSRVVRTALAVVSAFVLVVSVGGWAASEKYLSGLSKVSIFGLSGSSGWSGAPTNILLVGSDDRSGLSQRRANHLHTGSGEFGRHTDTMMLVHLGGDLGAVTVVSIPRDSLVTIPAHTDETTGQSVPEGPGKINSAYSGGGPSLMVQTVERATGMTIDHYVEVNFQGFLKMVDAVGGVDVCLSAPLQDEMSGLNLPAGRQTIHGQQALAYVRARYIDNDFGRAGRQQKFLSAMIQKVFSSGTLMNPVALNGFIDGAVNSLTIDEGLSRDGIAALAARAGDVDLGSVVFTTVPVEDGNRMVDGQSTVAWDQGGAAALFTALANDDPLPKPVKAAPVEVAPDAISVSVSGAGTQYDAALADLRGAGYAVTEAAPPTATPATTTVSYDPAWPKSLATLQAALPGATFQEKPGMGEVFTITVGSDYAGLRPVRDMGTVPEASSRTARDDICDTPASAQQ